MASSVRSGMAGSGGGGGGGGAGLGAWDPAPLGDLRRKEGRDDVQQYLHRAECLPPPDRELLRAIYADHRTLVEVAALTRADARSVGRRVRRLVERLLCPRFLFVLRERDQWPGPRRRIATAVVLHGRSLREVANETGMSLYSVRRHFEAICALHDASRDGRRAG